MAVPRLAEDKREEKLFLCHFSYAELRTYEKDIRKGHTKEREEKQTNEMDIRKK